VVLARLQQMINPEIKKTMSPCKNDQVEMQCLYAHLKIFLT